MARSAPPAGDGDAGTREAQRRSGQQRHMGTDDGRGARRRGYITSAVNYTLNCGNCARLAHFFDTNDGSKNNIVKKITSAFHVERGYFLLLHGLPGNARGSPTRLPASQAGPPREAGVS